MALAYVFWHWPAGDAPPYAERLRAFHHALAAEPPAGFRGSRSFAVQGAPWLPRAAGFEDWYLVDGFAELGGLNEAAVSGSRREPHDRAASLAGGGAGGVYRLKSGALLEVAGLAYWFAKPAGTSYETLFARLSPFTAQPGTALWQRQMVLGPTPEFCLQSSRPLDWPAAIAAVAVSCQPV